MSIHERIDSVADELRVYIRENFESIEVINDRVDSIDTRINNIVTLSSTHEEKIDTILNMDEEIMDRIEMQFNLLLHGFPE